MLIGSLSTTSSTPAVLNPSLAAKPSSAASAAPAAPGPSSTAPSAAAPATTSSPARPASSGGSHGGGGAAASSTSAILEVATSYSTTVGGTQYSGTVEESGGQYTASVPNLQGATATGSTEQAAENNLDARIDELV
jgi:hypothetical protein